jgi:hypothetical protein
MIKIKLSMIIGIVAITTELINLYTNVNNLSYNRACKKLWSFSLYCFISQKELNTPIIL